MTANDKIVLDAIRSVVPVKDLPRLLWWVGTVRGEALRKIEDLGCAVGDAMVVGESETELALTSWIVALRLAREKLKASGDTLGPRPIWAFWSLFTREHEPESPLSALLREAVGYPTDAEAGMAAGGERDA